MWCTNCQQDVPALASGDTARCAQCGRFLKRRADAPFAISASSAAVDDFSPPNFALPVPEAPVSPSDDWLLQQQVRHLQRRLRLSGSTDFAPAFSSTIASEPTTIKFPAPPAASVRPRSPIAAWIMIILGSIAFISGAAVITLATISGHDDLLCLGIPLALAGHLGLTFSLVLQLSHLRRANRHLAEMLESTDARLEQMNAATNHRAPSFIRHAA
jgi:hypothetical protein